MAEYTSKFIFTKEGRTLLVSQTGGIKFAILGYVLVGGLVNAVHPGNAQNAVSPRTGGQGQEIKYPLRDLWYEIEGIAKEKICLRWNILSIIQKLRFLCEALTIRL
jgi:hypothetical protein